MVSKVIISLAVFCFIGLVAAVPGGLSDERPADERILKILSDIEAEIKSSHSEIKTIEPVSYKSQVVAGTNYFIKCKATDEKDNISFVHVKVYKSLKNQINLTGVKKNLCNSEPINFF